MVPSMLSPFSLNILNGLPQLAHVMVTCSSVGTSSAAFCRGAALGTLMAAFCLGFALRLAVLECRAALECLALAFPAGLALLGAFLAFFAFFIAAAGFANTL